MEVLKKLQTLKTKLLVMLIAISFIPVLVTGILSYTTSQDLLSQKLKITSIQTTHEITRGLDNYFSAMSNTLHIAIPLLPLWLCVWISPVMTV
jgi:methyl-accepting chemotaxis protein